VRSRSAPALPAHAPHTFLPSSTSAASTTPKLFLLRSPLCASLRATAPRLPPLAPSHACRAPHPPGPSSPGPHAARPDRALRLLPLRSFAWALPAPRACAHAPAPCACAPLAPAPAQHLRRARTPISCAPASAPEPSRPGARAALAAHPPRAPARRPARFARELRPPAAPAAARLSAPAEPPAAACCAWIPSACQRPVLVPVEEREGNSSGDWDEARDMPPVWIRKHQEKKNRGEEGMEFSKDLCVISENCRDLFVKQNFPLI
jgi:hypothetical protein